MFQMLYTVTKTFPIQTKPSCLVTYWKDINVRIAFYLKHKLAGFEINPLPACKTCAGSYNSGTLLCGTIS